MKNYDYPQTILSRSLLSGLLAGLAAVMLNTLLDVIYRGESGFALSEIVNIPFIIFSSLIVAMTGGIVYFLLRKINRYKLVYMALFIILTLIGCIAASGIQRTSNPAMQHDFRILFCGVIIITGLCTAFLVPYFAKHDKIYNEG